MRSFCVGIATAANWTGAFLAALFTLTVLENSLGTTTVTALRRIECDRPDIHPQKLPETKGVALERIEEFFVTPAAEASVDES